MDILLHRHLVWTAVDASVWQPSVPQFSAPASLEVERRVGWGGLVERVWGGGTWDIDSDCETHKNKTVT